MVQRLLEYIGARPRRAIVAFFFIIVLVTLGFQLGYFLTTGTIKIKTNDANNTVSVRPNNDSTSNTRESKGDLEATLPPGQYVATVSNGATSVKRIVQVKARQTAAYAVNLNGLIVPEPVLPFGAYGVAADKSHLFYVDMRDNLLYEINGNNLPNALSKTVAFSKIIWQNPGHGIGIGSDKKTLFLVANGQVNPIALPFPSDTLSVSLSPSGQLVVASGDFLYKRSSNGRFNKIFSSDDAISSLTAGNNGVFVRFARSGNSSDSDSTGTAVIDYAGKVIARRDNMSAYAYAWSPKGDKLAVTNDSSTILYDTGLKKIGQSPDGNVLGMTWLNNTTLLYGQGKSLFSFSLATNNSTQLAVMNGTSGVSGIYVNQAQSQLYVLSEADGSSGSSISQNYEMMRVDLRGKKLPDYVYQLDVFFPAVEGGCGLSFINFSQPLITAAGPNSQGCLTLAKTELQQDGLPVDSFQLSFTGVTNEYND